MSRGWYGPPKDWREAARRAGALLAMGETAAARSAHRTAVSLYFTGRIPQEPNLQNIPIRTPEGTRIRDAFTGRKP